MKTIIIAVAALLALIAADAWGRPVTGDSQVGTRSSGATSCRPNDVNGGKNWPTGSTTGDLYIFEMYCRKDDGQTFTMPSPWTSFDSNEGNSGNGGINFHQWWAAYPGAGGFSNAEATATFGATASTFAVCSCVMYRITGANLTNPIESAPVHQLNTNTATHVFGGITTNHPDPLIIGLVGLDTNDGSMRSDATNWTPFLGGGYPDPYQRTNVTGPASIAQTDAKTTPTQNSRTSMWAVIDGSPTVTMTATTTPTPTRTPTITDTPSSTPTATPSGTATHTPTSTPTTTATPLNTATKTATRTSTPTVTDTPTRTATPTDTPTTLVAIVPVDTAAEIPTVGLLVGCAQPAAPTPAAPYLCAMDPGADRNSGESRGDQIKAVPDIGEMRRCDGTEAGVYFCRGTPTPGLPVVRVGSDGQTTAMDATGDVAECAVSGFQAFICDPE